MVCYLNTYKLNYFKAAALYRLERFWEALEEIDLSINKNDKNAMSYHLRTNIKSRLGLNGGLWRHQTHDYYMYESLRKQWIFPKL